jgi:hypothetical protein
MPWYDAGKYGVYYNAAPHSDKYNIGTEEYLPLQLEINGREVNFAVRDKPGFDILIGHSFLHAISDKPFPTFKMECLDLLRNLYKWSLEAEN